MYTSEYILEFSLNSRLAWQRIKNISYEAEPSWKIIHFNYFDIMVNFDTFLFEEMHIISKFLHKVSYINLYKIFNFGALIAVSLTFPWLILYNLTIVQNLLAVITLVGLDD